MRPRRVSMFVQIFVWFWATIALLTAAIIGLEFTTIQQPMAQGTRPLVARALRDEAKRVDFLWKQHNRQALERELLEFEAQTGATAFLLDAQTLRDVRGKNLPPTFQALLKNTNPASGLTWRVAGLQVEATIYPSPQTIFAVSFERGTFTATPISRVWRFIVTIIIAGLVCWLLARRFTTPILVLRQATKRLESGDLSARANLKQLKRNDEMTELARDFNAMATQIETLVGAQQRLVGDVSHELRSPLTRLKIALALAERDAPPSPQLTGHLERIRYESGTLEQLVGELLLLARLENRLPSQTAPIFDWVKTVATFAADMSWEAQNREDVVEITLHSEVETALVRGEESLLQRALENIGRNALYYSPSSSTISIELKQEGESLHTFVRDSGPGVPADELEAIFQPFYRVDTARARQEGSPTGTGLGLAIARRAVESNGGNIVARNQRDSGLEVEIILPIAEL